ncbi:MAG: bifunctional hydroxymethylpyrimidine kinase/phosphomethylpyrimidine kinase [Paracoccaceae bacterium]
MRTPIALSIAGSDPSGGAGIQADLKAISARGVYAAAAITVVTVQNTRGVSAVEALAPALVAAQIRTVLEDLEVGAVKIGALGSAPIVEAVAGALAGFAGPVVLDPVMVAKSGDPLLGAEAVAALREHLLPRATLVTPNLPEAAALTGLAPAADEAEMAAQGAALCALGAGHALVKGGHGAGAESVDLLIGPDGQRRLTAPRLPTRHTHGTGCTLSAAIAADLAKGTDLAAAVAGAKTYLTGALAAADALGIGQGIGPVHHFHAHWR